MDTTESLNSNIAKVIYTPLNINPRSPSWGDPSRLFPPDMCRGPAALPQPPSDFEESSRAAPSPQRVKCASLSSHGCPFPVKKVLRGTGGLPGGLEWRSGGGVLVRGVSTECEGQRRGPAHTPAAN